ncbi:MAG: hypothetical protein ACE5G5_06890 [Candidatus Methylomirabilales bacterium]
MELSWVETTIVAVAGASPPPQNPALGFHGIADRYSTSRYALLTTPQEYDL